MEVAAVPERFSIWLYSRRTPRDWNAKADALTDGQSGASSPDYRIAVEIEKIRRLVWPGLLSTGLEWHRRRPERRPRPVGAARDTSRRPLKERAPW